MGVLIRTIQLFLTSYIILCCTISQVVSSSSSSSSPSSPTSKNPFTNELTGVSGFGARSYKKTIFPTTNPILDVVVTTIAESSASSSHLVKNRSLGIEFDSSKILPDATSSRPNRLFVKKTKDPNDGDALWIQVREIDDIIDATTTTLRLSVDENTGDWNVKEQDQEEDTANDWIPIEGLYGVYRVPSGVIWILVSRTQGVYSAPPLLNSGDDNNNKSSWWKIRRVVNLELFHLSLCNLKLTTSHLREEIRQVKLLRQALKYHDFYFVPKKEESTLVTDMTKKLQTSLDVDKKNGNNAEWWEESTASTQRPDPRFFWNQVAVQPLLNKLNASETNSVNNNAVEALLQNSIPLTSAFVGIQSNVTIGDGTNMTYDELLISRRSKYRAGTRFTRRGADAAGSVANFAETEQISLIYSQDPYRLRHIMSHVQTRGSIPLRWSSPADVKTYRPRVRIGMDPLAQARALRLHLLEQHSYYGSQGQQQQSNRSTKPELVFVNLIDKHSDQGRLGRTFDAVLNAVIEVHSMNDQSGVTGTNMTSRNTTASSDDFVASSYATPSKTGFLSRLLGSSTVTTQENEPVVSPTNQRRRPSVEHIWYDFHAEVKGGRWHKLATLLEDLQPSLIDHGFFQANVNPNQTDHYIQIQRRQSGAVRTNCMDCLDRTNVVQSMFGRYMLFQQLSAVANDFTEEEKGRKWDELRQAFQGNELTLPWSNGELSHRPLWADNADAISRLYAGTPALKRDFTRTGKRTKRGALDDGMNSLQRYYLNNFLDADRQEGMDLLVGYANFSNAELIDTEDGDFAEDSVSGSTDEKIMVSIQEAARKAFFGNILDEMNPDDSGDAQKRLDEIGVTRDGARVGKRNLDLRWLPGDLQCHVISQVEEAQAASAAESQPQKNAKGHFSSTKAIEAIDHRSASFFPWWAEIDDDNSIDDGDDLEGKGKDVEDAVTGLVDDKNDLPLPQHKQQLGPLPPTQLMGVVLVAAQAPLTLAGIVVVLLTLTFLPDVIG